MGICQYWHTTAWLGGSKLRRRKKQKYEVGTKISAKKCWECLLTCTASPVMFALRWISSGNVLYSLYLSWTSLITHMSQHWSCAFENVFQQMFSVSLAYFLWCFGPYYLKYIHLSAKLQLKLSHHGYCAICTACSPLHKVDFWAFKLEITSSQLITGTCGLAVG